MANTEEPTSFNPWKVLGWFGAGAGAQQLIVPVLGESSLRHWILYGALIVTVAVVSAVLPGQFFARDRHGTSLLARIVAWALLALFATGSLALPLFQAPLWTHILVLGCLWVALVAMGTATLGRSATDLGLSAASGLVGVAMLLLGVTALRDGNTLNGVAALLLGVAALLLGVAALRDGDTLWGVPFLLTGVALLLWGVATLRDGETLWGVAFLLMGVALLLLGVATLLAGVAILLAGVAALLLGVAALRDGHTLAGVAALLLGVAGLLLGVAALRDRAPLDRLRDRLLATPPTSERGK